MRRVSVYLECGLVVLELRAVLRLPRLERGQLRKAAAHRLRPARLGSHLHLRLSHGFALLLLLLSRLLFLRLLLLLLIVIVVLLLLLFLYVLLVRRFAFRLLRVDFVHLRLARLHQLGRSCSEAEHRLA